MKASLKYIILFSVCFVFSTSIANAADKVKINFESVPAGATVSVSISYVGTSDNSHVLGQCVTPCALTLDESSTFMNLHMTKSGYQERFEKAYIRGVGVFKKKSIRFQTDNKKSAKDSISRDTIHWTLAMLEDEKLDAEKIANESHIIKARPILRKMPSAPRWLEKNEKCKINFHVDKTGKPMDVTAVCDEKKLEKRAIKAVKKWRYEPRMENDVAVKSAPLSVFMRWG